VIDARIVSVEHAELELLSDTESPQDHPIGGSKPANPAGPSKPTEPAPTKQERNALAQYSTAYMRLYRKEG